MGIEKCHPRPQPSALFPPDLRIRKFELFTPHLAVFPISVTRLLARKSPILETTLGQQNQANLNRFPDASFRQLPHGCWNSKTSMCTQQ